MRLPSSAVNQSRPPARGDVESPAPAATVDGSREGETTPAVRDPPDLAGAASREPERSSVPVIPQGLQRGRKRELVGHGAGGVMRRSIVPRAG